MIDFHTRVNWKPSKVSTMRKTTEYYMKIKKFRYFSPWKVCTQITTALPSPLLYNMLKWQVIETSINANNIQHERESSLNSCILKYILLLTAWVSNKIGLIKLRWYSLICRKTGHHTNLNLKNKSSFARCLEDWNLITSERNKKIYNTKAMKANRFYMNNYIAKKWIFQKGHSAVYSPNVQ